MNLHKGPIHSKMGGTVWQKEKLNQRFFEFCLYYHTDLKASKTAAVLNFSKKLNRKDM